VSTVARPLPGAREGRGAAVLRNRLESAVWFAVPFVALLAVWYVVVAVTGVPLRVFPQVDAVVRAGARLAADGSLLAHIGASLQRVAIGTAIAVVTAVPFGVLMGVNRHVSAFFTPLLRFSVALAGIAWIPLATLWFGYGEGAVTFIIWNSVFFALTYNTMLGVSRIPLELRRAASNIGIGGLRLFVDVLVPGALPSIVTGLRVGLGYGWRGLIAAEIIAAGAGLGYALFLAQKFYETDVIVLSMIVIGALWLLVDRLLLAPMERRTVERWGMKSVVD
jgi:NitT/TauT family transport system permease protein/taurine transport system permease protein